MNEINKDHLLYQALNYMKNRKTHKRFIGK